MKIMIKIGTAAIFDSTKQKIKENIIESLAKEVSNLIKEGNEIIIVSSGAVGGGKNLVKGNNEIGLKQAQSSIGQVKLMEKYSQIFSKYNTHIAQFLLTSQDIKNKNSLKNIIETYKHLKRENVIPIVNENDITSLEELSFGDNDFLATELLLGLDFEKLIILTEIGVLIKNKEPITSSNFFSVEDYDKMKIPPTGFGDRKSVV